MIELLYPFEGLAPSVPAVNASTTMKASKTDAEMFPVIQPDGLVVGRAERSYCHSGSHVLHPVVHLHVINRNEQIYIQKRSMKKEIQPGKWDTSVGGHVIYGEGILEALMREASEEIGMSEFNPIYIETYIWETDRDNEHVNIFAAVGNFHPVPDLDEVDEGRWWPMDEIDRNLDKDIFTPNFVFEYNRIKQRLRALL